MFKHLSTCRIRRPHYSHPTRTFLQINVHEYLHVDTARGAIVPLECTCTRMRTFRLNLKYTGEGNFMQNKPTHNEREIDLIKR